MSVMDSSNSAPAGPQNDWFRDGDSPAKPVEPEQSRNSNFVPLFLSHMESMTVLGTLPPFFLDQAFEGDLGDGSFFDVQKKSIERGGKTSVVAVKRLKSSAVASSNPQPRHSATDSRSLRVMLREIQVMETMENCPFTLQLLDVGSWSDPDFRSMPFLLVEFAASGTLTKFLAIQKPTDAAVSDLAAYVASRYHDRDYALRKSLLLDVARGLHALHQAGIFHTDLKPDNILIFGTGNGPQDNIIANRFHAKVSDFGSSIMRNKATPDRRILFGRDSGGTRGYMAPELYGMRASEVLNLSDSALRMLDTFSFGVVLVEAISSCRVTGAPFDGGLTADSVVPLLGPFVRSHVGAAEWDDTITKLLGSCLTGSPLRSDEFGYLLALFGQESQESEETSAKTLSKPTPTSKLLAFIDGASQLVKASGEDLNIPLLLTDYPVPAFDLLGNMRAFRRGLDGLQPFQEILRQWIEAMPQDKGEHHLASGLSHVFGCGVISFEDCCDNLLEAARRDNSTAQIIYKRFYEALFSIFLGESQPPSLITPTAIRDINPDIFQALEELVELRPDDNHVAHLIRFCERSTWAMLIDNRLCERMELEPAEATSWDVIGHGRIHDERIKGFLRQQICSLRSLPSAGPNSELLAPRHYDLLMAAAIVFGDEQSECDQLELLCDTFDGLGISLNDLVITSLDDSDNSISPLMLASCCGNAHAVRVLAKAADGPSAKQQRCGDGPIPLHYLFAFAEDDIDDVCRILADGISLEGIHSGLFYPAGHFCSLAGSPLDFSLKVGSVAATASLWRQIYSRDHRFRETIRVYPSMDSKFLETIPHLVDIPPLDAFAIRCWGSMQPSMWELFLTLLDEEEDPQATRVEMTARLRERVFDGDVSDRGHYYFITCIILTFAFPLLPMLLHGPKYTERLTQQLRRGMKFFMDVSHPDFVPFLFDPVVTLTPDPHLQVALVEACQGLGTAPEAAQYDTETLKGLFFLLIVKGAEQRLSLGHSLGFVMPKNQPAETIFKALAAAAGAGDAPAYRRIVQKSAEYGINLPEEGAVQFLAAWFARNHNPLQQPANVIRQYLDAVSEMPVLPQSRSGRPWRFTFVPTWLHVSAMEHRHSKTGRVLWDAVKYDNLPLVLALVDRNPSHLYPGLIEPGVFFLLCVNDRHRAVLQGLLEHLGPAKSLDCLRRRTRFPSRLTAMDVAVYHGSTQCLLVIARFLSAAVVPLDALFPGNKNGNGLMDTLPVSLFDCARGYQVLMGLSGVLASPWRALTSRQWGSDLESHVGEAIVVPGLLSIVPFVWEMCRHEPARFEAVQSSVKQLFGADFDISLASQRNNNRPMSKDKLDPADEVGMVWAVSCVGKAAKHWKLSLLVVGIFTYTSVTVSRVLVRELFIRKG
ncbi:hypothetical protein B0T18DRAFT_239281 [Schizothecium vesticola]|uniref:Protein kinase domain-containing protein n=1 Tax=Schizothecium vesticola TaxID=314040 RepID=A0AA40BQ01_9PEZI|nr:hypothetical protein B0T18DRAFT_239281 [Schizothecium vesticola]